MGERGAAVPGVGEQQEGESGGTEPCSSLSSPRVELLHRRAFCTARVEWGGRDPFARRRAPLPSGMGTGMCVNAGGCQHCTLVCVCVCKCTCPAPPEGLLWGMATSGCPGGHPHSGGSPDPSSTVPTQAASSQPGTATVRLWLMLSLESQIPAVVWGNKCAERAEYLMGPLSARNDSGNEPPLCSGCQGLLLCLLAALPGAALPAGARSVPGRGVRYRGLRSLPRGEEAPWGWKWLMQHVLLHFVPIAAKPF